MTAGTPGVIRVLVADDQPLERAGLALILDSDVDLDVVGQAANGVEAVGMTPRCQPDIVLMDVRMPIMDGIQATQIITEQHPTTKVIVLTTFDLDEYAFGSLRAGASAFLLKTTKPEALVDAIKTVHSGSAVAAPRLTAKLIEHYLTPTRQPTDAASLVQTQSRILDRLSPREREIFSAIVRGLNNAEISSELVLAPSTIKSHINSIFSKLGLRDRVHAVILGHECAWISSASEPNWPSGVAHDPSALA